MAPHDSPSSGQSVLALDDENSYSGEPRRTTSCVSFHARKVLSLQCSKAVSFGDAVKVMETICIDDYTPEELQSCWYSAQEYDAIQDQCLAEASRLCGKDLCNRSMVRGLECFIQEIVEAFQSTRDATIWSVIEEQQLQREEGSFDPEFISEIYEQQSLLARVQASITGVNDRLEAMK